MITGIIKKILVYKIGIQNINSEGMNMKAKYI